MVFAGVKRKDKKKTGLNQEKNDFETKGKITMKKDELMKLGLEEDLAKKVETASLEGLKGFIPKARFDEVNTEKNALQQVLKERDTQLETLKNSTGDIEGLKKQIADLQTENAATQQAHAEEIRALKISTSIDAALTAAKARNGKVVRALLDLDKAELGEDGKVKGLVEQIQALQKAEDSKFLFDAEPAVKQTKIRGATPAETGVEDPDTKVDFSKMTYEELAAYMEANPDVQI